MVFQANFVRIPKVKLIQHCRHYDYPADHLGGGYYCCHDKAKFASRQYASGAAPIAQNQVYNERCRYEGEHKKGE
jgi:hypothetical protein